MAVQTAATTIRESMGSLTYHIFTFTSVSSGDTFATGLGTQIVGFWAQGTANVGTGANLASANLTNASGTLTVSGSITSLALTIFVVSKS